MKLFCNDTVVLRWSDNWLLFNQKSIQDRKQLDLKAKQPGYCHYPNIDKHNEAIRIKKAGGSSISIQQSTITDPPEEDTLQQLELFPQLAA